MIPKKVLHNLAREIRSHIDEYNDEAFYYSRFPKSDEIEQYYTGKATACEEILEEIERILNEGSGSMKKEHILFPICFSDLTKKAQKRLMDAVHINEPGEMNWDLEIDMAPLAYYETTITEEEK